MDAMRVHFLREHSFLAWSCPLDRKSVRRNSIVIYTAQTRILFITSNYRANRVFAEEVRYAAIAYRLIIELYH